MKKNQIDIVTMGCSKNLVDSETLMKQFEANGYHCTHDAKRPQGEIAVINTCGFIESAKEESINTILEFIQAKEEGRLNKLYVMGCLSQRYKDELEAEMPQVDKFYGKFNYKQLLADLGKSFVPSCDGQRHLTTPRHYAYLKISEGCNRQCAYCAIPAMTGKHQSRKKEEIINEVKELVEQGVKELQIIAQELTYYGVDVDGRRQIAELIEAIADVPGVKWIRLHYAYPNEFPLELLDVMRRKPNVCKYLDIALQHISDPVLAKMKRNVSKEETLNLIKKIREAVPGIHLRTTLMVGHPGETKEAFQELLDFVRETRFERMGAFAYSHEVGTYAYKHYQDEIPEEVKMERLEQLMALQEPIAEAYSRSLVGTTQEVLIDRREEEFVVGRTQYDSPEVDPEVLIPVEQAHSLRVGHYYSLPIVGVDRFDLLAQAPLSR